MENNLQIAQQGKKTSLIQFFCIVCARYLSGVFGASIKLICNHKMSSNLYLFCLQSYQYITNYMTLRLTDLHELEGSENKDVRV